MPAGTLATGLSVLLTLDGGHRSEPTARDLEARFALTPRQADIALLLARRLTNREIGAALHISVNTVHRHTEAVMLKLGVRSRRDIADRIAPQD
jgi:DNA-binding NarL/FixJ family response regulator